MGSLFHPGGGAKSESEIRNPKERPKSETERAPGRSSLRISGFGFLSDFGFRISDFGFLMRFDPFHVLGEAAEPIGVHLMQPIPDLVKHGDILAKDGEQVRERVAAAAQFAVVVEIGFEPAPG